MKKYCLYFSEGPCEWIWASSVKEARERGRRLAKARGCKFVDLGDCCGL